MVTHILNILQPMNMTLCLAQALQGEYGLETLYIVKLCVFTNVCRFRHYALLNRKAYAKFQVKFCT